MAIGRLICSVPQPSFDGRYYAKYPTGNAPPIALAGTTNVAAAATAALSTGGSALNFGDALTINGSGFGTKSITAAGPQVWDYGQAGAGVLDSQWDGSNPSTVSGGVGNYKNYAPGTNGVAVPNIHVLNIGGGLHGHFNDFSIVGPWLDFNVTGGLTYPFYVFIDLYFMVDARWKFNLDATDSNFKHNIFGTSGGGIDGNSWYEEYENNSFTDASALPDEHLNDDNGSFNTTPPWFGTGVLNPTGVWLKRQYLYKISNVNNGGFIHSWEKGSQCMNQTMRTDAIPGTDRSIQVGGYARQYTDPVGVNTTQWRYYAAKLVCVDTNPGRFMMGNNSSIAACTKLHAQPWTSWGATSVAVKVNQGDLGAGTWPIHYLDEVNGNQANVATATVNA